MLHLNGLGKRFGDQWILRDLNLQVHAGECVALLGPSGCGKSTALRLIAGLERQDEGSIELDGAALDSIPAERRSIAMVFQSYALFPHLSVRENLNLGLKIRRVRATATTDRIGVGDGATAGDGRSTSPAAFRRPASTGCPGQSSAPRSRVTCWMNR